MANSAADTERERGADSTQPAGAPPPAGREAPLGPTVALAVAFAIGLFVVALGLVLIPTSPKPLPPPLTEQEQNAESALYVVCFGLILPAVLIAVPRLADAVARGPNARALSVLSAIVVSALAVSILVLRALPGGGSVVEGLGVVGAWWLVTIATFARATRPRPWARLLAVAHLGRFAWALAGALVLGTLLAFTTLGSISALPIALGAVAVPATLLAYSAGWDRLAARAASLGRGDRRRDHLRLPAGRSRPGHLRRRLSIRGVHQSRDPVPPRLLPGTGQRGAARQRRAGGHGLAVRGRAPSTSWQAGSRSRRSATEPWDSWTGACSRSSLRPATA